MNYKDGINPFNRAYGGSAFSVRDWWQALGATGLCPQLVQLAIMLLDVVPHAAAPERMFSMMGWYEGCTRNKLGIQTTAMMTTIRQFYNQQRRPEVQQSRKSKAPRKEGDAHVVVVLDEGEVGASTQEGVSAASAPKAAAGACVAVADPQLAAHLARVNGEVEKEVAAAQAAEIEGEAMEANDLEGMLNALAFQDAAHDTASVDALPPHAQYLSFTQLLMSDWDHFDLDDPKLFEPGQEAPEVVPSAPTMQLGGYDDCTYDEHTLVEALLRNVSGGRTD